MYGNVELLEPRKPFDLIVWENAAYLVDDERRTRVFLTLKSTIGVETSALLDAGVNRIARSIADGGMQPAHRAAKVLRCAEIVHEFASGNLSSALRRATDSDRRRLLERFPGIGEPGVDKVLLLCGYAARPALESNGLRVLERLGFIAPSKSYASAYRAGTASLLEQPLDFVEAFALLRKHGRELCKRSRPVCSACELRDNCAFARARTAG